MVFQMPGEPTNFLTTVNALLVMSFQNTLKMIKEKLTCDKMKL